MAKPSRHASPERIAGSARTFFATTKTSQGARLPQSERNALLLVEVLRSYAKAGNSKPMTL
jgi:putative transposase